MSVIPSPPTAAVLDPTFPWPRVELIETDGEPLESDWHRIAINLLIESVVCHLAPRKDYYAGGNMFIYYSAEQARNREFRGPDFFFVDGVASEPIRPYWAVWEEGGHYPDVMVELLSPTTAEEDRTTKKALYERTFRTAEYYCYDPDAKHLEGWRLNDHRRYEALAADEHGRLWCEQLELWLGTWDGVFMERHLTWLRFFKPDGGIVPVYAEVERGAAEAERRRADAADQRADALTAEVAQLKAQLAAKRKRRKP